MSYCVNTIPMTTTRYRFFVFAIRNALHYESKYIMSEEFVFGTNPNKFFSLRTSFLRKSNKVFYMSFTFITLLRFALDKNTIDHWMNMENDDFFICQKIFAIFFFDKSLVLQKMTRIQADSIRISCFFCLKSNACCFD